MSVKVISNKTEAEKKKLMEQHKQARKEILRKNRLDKKLMCVYCRELRPANDSGGFMPVSYPMEWFYIDKDWFYHKLQIVRKETVEGKQYGYMIVDFLCDPAYAFVERSATVYWGLNIVASKEGCEQLLTRSYGKPACREEIPVVY